MKRIVSIDKTFDVIRSMDPGIQFAEIEQFVLQHPLFSHPNLFHWTKFKTILPMFAITSAVAAALLFTQPHHATISAEKQENKQQLTEPQNTEIKIPFKEIDPSPIINESGTAIKQESAVVNSQSSTPETNRDADMAMISGQSLMPADSPARKKTISTIVNGRSVTVISSTPSSTVTTNVNSGSVSATSSADGDSTEVIVNNSNGPEKTIIHAKTQAGTKCNCNFGDDQSWVDDIVQELLKQNLISNECNYNFRLSPESLSVNGKEITDKEVISKLKDFYESSTNDHMASDDYISVKVTRSTCDFVKNINDK